MANRSILEIIIGLKDRTAGELEKLGKGIKDIHSKIGALKAAAVETWEVFKGAANIYFAPLKAVAVPALAAVTTSIGLMIKAVREWAGQELGEADVKSALLAMGQYTDQYRDQLIQLSDTYQKTTGIADDMWLKSLGQLTRFGMNASNVDRVSTALKNLTGLMDGNLDGATDMLAKAMQGEFGMFSRYGIIIQQTGDQVKDLDAAITAINAKGVGLLEARANTLSGKWTGLKNQANEVFEAIGKKLADSLEIGGAITKAKDWLATLTSAVQSGGLGELISKGGQELREHIEAAVKWAEQIAKAIKDSGKPLDEIFATALRAAADVFMKTLTALLVASMSIWKAVGIAIFEAFKEQFLLLPGMGPIRDIAASNGAKRMTPGEKANFAADNGLVQESKNGRATGNLISMGPVTDERRAEISAKMATYDSESKIKAAIDIGVTELKAAGQQLKTDLTGIVDKAVGISPDGTKSGGKSTVTTTDANGNEVTMALEEYIAQLKAQNEKVAEAVDAGTEQATTTTETIEGATKAVEESTKQMEAVKTSHTAIESAMKSSSAAATATSQVATQAVQVTQQVVAVQAQQAGQLSILWNEINRIQSQLRSMRA
jgi:hypothetical protein